MMAAVAAASNGHTRVVVLDKMEDTGSKLLITGKGKCNITHQVNKLDEIFEGYPGGAQFLHSSFHRFPPEKLLNFFETRGLNFKTDRGKRIFPVTDSAKDVRNVLMKELAKLKVSVKLCTPAIEIMHANGKVTGLRTAQKEIIEADSIIIATGGMTYPWTGSTGDGYQIAKKTGHNLIPPRPSLVPLEIKNKQMSFALEGLALKNVKASLKCGNKTADQKFGEMVFTSYGLSGPIILYLSRQAVNLLAERKEEVSISLDLKPALSREKLNAKLEADLEKNKKKAVKNLFEEYIPQKMIPVLLEEASVSPGKQCAQISAKEKRRLCELMKNMEFGISKARGMSEAEVTQGGVDLKEIDPKTMESRVLSGLYFVGEVLDVDGYIGGFNLQAAFSTGFAAGIHASQKG